jgi:hypothetical protein
MRAPQGEPHFLHFLLLRAFLAFRASKLLHLLVAKKQGRERDHPSRSPLEGAVRQTHCPGRPRRNAFSERHETWPQEQRLSRAMGPAMDHLQRCRLRSTWCLLGHLWSRSSTGAAPADHCKQSEATQSDRQPRTEISDPPTQAACIPHVMALDLPAGTDGLRFACRCLGRRATARRVILSPTAVPNDEEGAAETSHAAGPPHCRGAAATLARHRPK